MKKKIIIFLFSFLLLLGVVSIFPLKASAQGKFKCAWDPFQNKCVVDSGTDPSSPHCDQNYKPDPSLCSKFNNYGDCWKQANTPLNCVKAPTSDVLCKPNGGTDNTGIQTAIGCIPTLSNTNDFLAFILKWAVGVGGGIAFLLIVYGGFMVMSSSGNPERLKAGQELITSALSGLILLIFSVFILKFIGIDILGLGAFGFGIH